MSKKNLLKLTLITLAVIVLAIVSFGGIYVTDKNNVKNILPEYVLSKDFKGYRLLEFSKKEIEVVVDSENNEERKDTKEDYDKCKEILENRLIKMGITDYIIRLNEDNGKIVLEIPEYEDMDPIVVELSYQGKFEIVDTTSKEVLMDNSDLDRAEVGYGSDNTGNTVVYFSFIFTEAGKEKFKNVTNTYRHVENTETTEESTESEENSEEKTISLNYDGETLFSTHFEEEISNGILQLNLGTSANNTIAELQERMSEASRLSLALNLGKLPIELDLQKDIFVESDISQAKISIVIFIMLAVVCIAMIYSVIKYKMLGFRANVSLVGFIALLLLAVRIFNVEISISGIIALIISIVIEIIMLINILKDNKEGISIKTALVQNIKKYIVVLVPAFIVSIVFTLSNLNYGAVLFWGLFINILYNLSLTRLVMIDKK